MANIAKIIRNLREDAELSLTDLSEKSNLSLAYLSKLESDKFKALSLKTSKSLAEGLGLSLKDFLERVGYLEADNKTAGSKMINNALRSNGYTMEQAKIILKYAEFIKKQKI